jgi:NADP-dependent 3-hydroxy acid dehydrogenase YdfG
MPGSDLAALGGRTALVTGASRGIGLAVSRALAGAGARVLLLARDSAALRRAVDSLGGGADALPCDLERPEEVARAVDETRRLAGGPPDILVQNAGRFTIGEVGRAEPGEFDAMLAVNLLGPYRFLQAFVPAMRERGSGDIVTIGSVADRAAYPENAAYAASKFAARAVHEVLREELRGSGVRVSLVSPGPVDTTIWDAIDPDSRPGFTPRARMLRPESVADAVLYVLTRPPDVDVEELRLARS